MSMHVFSLKSVTQNTSESIHINDLNLYLKKYAYQYNETSISMSKNIASDIRASRYKNIMHQSVISIKVTKVIHPKRVKAKHGIQLITYNFQNKKLEGSTIKRLVPMTRKST